MENSIAVGILLASVSGIMNGSFTLPMRFLGRWDWEHVWSLFIAISCLLMPAVLVAAVAPQSWTVLVHAPAMALTIAAATGFAWGFGSLMFGQSVSAIGISLANTLVLAISSSIGSVLPLVLLMPQKLLTREGHWILGAVAVEIVGIAFCGSAGSLRDRESGVSADRGNLVGKARPMSVALLLAIGSGVLSAVFNVGFALARPIADYGRLRGLSEFASTNLIWVVMLAAGSIANLAYCGYLLTKNRNLAKFTSPSCGRLYVLSALMALLWGGSIFVYGAAAPRLGTLGTSIGWPLSLAIGLVLANGIGMGVGEWKHASPRAHRRMYFGIAILLIAIIGLGRAGVQ